MLTAQFTAENAMGTEEDFTVRTGVLEFEGDWPGVFIRGDDALSYAAMIRKVLKGIGEPPAAISSTDMFEAEKLECFGPPTDLRASLGGKPRKVLSLAADKAAVEVLPWHDLEKLAKVLESCRVPKDNA